MRPAALTTRASLAMLACPPIAALLLATLLLAACASRPGPATGARAAVATGDLRGAANAVLFRAIGLVGTPYRYGGNTPDGGFDCSGLVGFVFSDAAGLSLPRRSSDIAGIAAPTVARTALAPGDLVFFGRSGISHVGIYVGDGRFVHAPSRGGTVRLDALDSPYWQSRFAFGKRALALR